MKERIQGVIIGVVAAVALSGATALAASGTQNIAVTYSDVKLYVDGVMITPRDYDGNIVEPFIYNGTTYLPIRAVGQAFGKEVDWDGSTASVYVGGRPSTAAKEVLLYNKPYMEVGHVGGFSVTGDDRQNSIKLTSANDAMQELDNDRYFFSDYVVYPLNAAATNFKAFLNPPLDFSSYSGRTYCSSPELVYKIYSDETLLYTSPILAPTTLAQSVDINVSGVIQLRIEVEMTASSTVGVESTLREPLVEEDYRGIENATIITTDY